MITYRDELDYLEDEARQDLEWEIAQWPDCTECGGKRNPDTQECPCDDPAWLDACGALYRIFLPVEAA